MNKLINLDDLAEITNLFVKVFNNKPWNDSWTFDTAEKRLASMINSSDFSGMVKHENGRAIGMIMGQKEQFYDGVHFQIVEFCVDTDEHNKGYGTQLLSDFLKHLNSFGIIKVYLMTMRGVAAEGFYLKNSFEAIEDFIIMAKGLD